MRITDLFLAIPFLVFAILILGLPQSQAWARTVIGEDHSVRAVIFVIAAIFWMPVARILRGLALSLKEKEFVEAARAAGASNGRIMFRPHRAELHRPDNHQHDAFRRSLRDPHRVGLSFLGFGVDSVKTPTWGNLLELSRNFLSAYPFLVWAPGIAVILTVLCVNFIGDGLRDALDPKQLSVVMDSPRGRGDRRRGNPKSRPLRRGRLSSRSAT